MCLAVPLKITEVDGMDGIAERAGIRRSIRLDFIPDPAPGGYVIVHAGFAIERLRPEQAQASLSAIQEVEDALRESR